MKTKEGGVMEIQKEREAFETWLFSTEKFKFRNKNFLFMLDEYGSYEDKPVLEHWETWQAAKVQAVPEGFAVVPIEITPKQIEAYMKGKIFPSSISEHRKFVKRLSKDYTAMIKAQEPAND